MNKMCYNTRVRLTDLQQTAVPTLFTARDRVVFMPRGLNKSIWGDKTPTTEERFWVKVKKTVKCWSWLNGTDPKGYGRFYDGTRNIPAHRFSYELCNEGIPEGMVIDHLCRNTSCVNPSHMEVVTPRENTLRGNGPTANNYHKTQCNYGHEFTPENTYYHKGKYRYCITCRKRRDKVGREKRANSPGRENGYRCAFKDGLGGSAKEETWDKESRTHLCCESKVPWRHKVLCKKLEAKIKP